MLITRAWRWNAPWISWENRRPRWVTVCNKAVYIALAILPDGTKEILGLWIEQTEGAKFWLRVMHE